LNWSIGNFDGEILKSHTKLIDSIENFLLNDFDKDSLVPIGLCSIIHTFAKHNLGSE